MRGYNGEKGGYKSVRVEIIVKGGRFEGEIRGKIHPHALYIQ